MGNVNYKPTAGICIACEKPSRVRYQVCDENGKLFIRRSRPAADRAMCQPCAEYTLETTRERVKRAAARS